MSIGFEKNYNQNSTPNLKVEGLKETLSKFFLLGVIGLKGGKGSNAS